MRQKIVASKRSSLFGLRSLERLLLSYNTGHISLKVTSRRRSDLARCFGSRRASDDSSSFVDVVDITSSPNVAASSAARDALLLLGGDVIRKSSPNRSADGFETSSTSGSSSCDPGLTDGLSEVSWSGSCNDST